MMKVLVHCDNVFDYLTRGPFPSGDAADPAIEAHLMACHECRCLAEALRPAVNLFHESMAEQPEPGLPAYLGKIEEQIRQHEVSPPNAGIERMAGARRAWRQVLAGVAIGLAVALLVWVGVPSADSREMTSSSGAGGRVGVDVSTTASSDGRAWVVAMGLPLSCFPAKEHSSITLPNTSKVAAGSSADLVERLVCCTRCHASQRISLVSDRGRQIVMSSCVACHESPRAQLNNLYSGIWRGSLKSMAI